MLSHFVLKNLLFFGSSWELTFPVLESIYFWRERAERFKIRCTNQNGSHPMLPEKGHVEVSVEDAEL